MWELDHEENWVQKNWRFWTVVLEKTLESPLDCREIHPVNPKGNQSWIFIGRLDDEAEASILWTPEAKNWLIGKATDAERDWGQGKKGTTEDEMIVWHHQLDRPKFVQALGVVNEQGSLAYCSPWVTKFLTWLSIWTELNWLSYWIFSLRNKLHVRKNNFVY